MQADLREREINHSCRREERRKQVEESEGEIISFRRPKCQMTITMKRDPL